MSLIPSSASGKEKSLMRLWTALSKLIADIFCNSLIETMLLLKHQTQFTKKKEEKCCLQRGNWKSGKIQKTEKAALFSDKHILVRLFDQSSKQLQRTPKVMNVSAYACVIMCNYAK